MTGFRRERGVARPTSPAATSPVELSGGPGILGRDSPVTFLLVARLLALEVDMPGRFAALLALLPLVAAPAAPAVAQEREFYTGYKGSLPSDPRLLARTYFDELQVRALIFEVEAGPVSRKRAEEVLDGSDATLADLLRVGLLREDDGRYAVGFNYFNAADMRAVVVAAEKHVPSLVAAYLEHRSELDRILGDYPVKTVTQDRLAFVLIAGFSLNWDGLAVTRDAGFREDLLVEGNGFGYSFWASEAIPGHDTHGFYWGSSTLPGGRFNYEEDPVDWSFSSFGDPYSDPRMNFPDLLLTSADEMEPGVREAARRIGLIHDTSFGGDFRDVLGFESGRDFATLLFRLREGPKGMEVLAEGFGDPAKLGAYLDLLEEIQYVERDEGGVYHLLVPVLDHADRPLVDAALRWSREVLTGWLAAHYPEIRKEMGSLTAMRQGVPFESLFTQIWHELFGLTTRELVRSGLLFDPSGPKIRYKGSYPVLWRQDLYDFDS